VPVFEISDLPRDLIDAQGDGAGKLFVVEQKAAAEGQKPQQLLRQQFVSLGEQRGDFVAVLSGLKEGDRVVSTGVFKLRNGQPVVVDNSIALEPQITRP